MRREEVSFVCNRIYRSQSRFTALKKEREEKERGGEDAAPLVQVNQNISAKQRKKEKQRMFNV